jgi:hypothetical protein
LARAGAAAKERASFPQMLVPPGTYSTIVGYTGGQLWFFADIKISSNSSISFTETLICGRAIGARGTPSIPWTLGKGHTWTECYDRVKDSFLRSMDSPVTDDYRYYSLIEDFMHGG